MRCNAQVCAEALHGSQENAGGPRRCSAGLFFLCVWLCTEPSVMAEELLLLVPSKKRLSGQQKTEIGTGRLEVLLCSYCP